MGASEHAEDNPELVGSERYYKSDLRPLPMIFVQRKRSWSSYTPGGEMLEYCPGLIPEGRMPGLEEIDQAEAQRWLSAEFEQVTRPDGEVVLKERAPGAAEAEPLIFKPRRWRQLVFGPALYFVLIYVVYAVVLDLVVHGGDGSADGARSDGPVALGAGLLFGFVLLVLILFVVTMSTFRGRLATYALSSSDTSIVAQAGFWRSRPSSLPVREIDRGRSARRGLFARLFGWQWLYSKHGARVMLFRRYFDPADIQELMRRLGMQA